MLKGLHGSRHSIRFLVAATILMLAASASFASAVPPIRITRTETASPSETRPWLVQFLFDQSGSMLSPCDEDPLGKNRPRWDVVIEDARKKTLQLQEVLGGFDLKIYTFGSKAAAYESPIEGRAYAIAGKGDAEEIGRELSRISTPSRGETTNLWNSLTALVSGAAADPDIRNYSGVLTIVFSDGLDDLGARGGSEPVRYDQFQRSLEAARRRIDLRLSVLAIGDWMRHQERLADLGAIGDLGRLGELTVVPKVVRCDVEPTATTVAPMPERGAETTIPIVLSGFRIEGPSPKATLRDAPAGLEILGTNFTGDTGSVALRATRPLADGASAWVVLEFDSGASPHPVAFRVVVPSFRRVPDIESWGLPAPCAALGDRRTILLRAGEPLSLTIPAPSDGKVVWTLDGAEAGDGVSLRATSLEAGLHKLRIEVSTPDESRSADVDVFVVDPRMSIESPDSIRAGDMLEARARLAVPLPQGLSALLTPIRWTASGRAIGAGDTMSTSFDRRGSERIAASCSLEACGRSLDFGTTAIVEVRPGPALRLVGGQLVRGRPTRIEAILSQPSEISRVAFSVGGRVVDAVVDQPLPDGTAVAWTEYTAESADPVEIVATPILKDDRGVDRPPSDPECTRRAQSRTFTVVEPDVGIVVEQPTQGSNLPYGIAFDLTVRPEGRDSTVVSSVEVALTPDRGTPSSLTLTKGGNWSASVTPSPAMGARLRLDAQAFEGKRPIGDAVRLEVELTAPSPALLLTGAAASGTLSWSGRNVQPPPVTATVVVEGTDQPYPLEGLQTIEWSTDDGIAVESRTDSDRSIGARAQAPGTARISARVQTRDGRNYELRRDVVVRPEPVVGLLSAAETTLTGSDAIDPLHDGTTGAWTDVRLRLRRGGRDWEPYEPGAIVEALGGTEPEEIEVEAWYRPWSVADTETPWVEGSGWVRAEPLLLTLTPPRDWTWPAVALLACLMLAYLWHSLFSGHELVGHVVNWHNDAEAGSRTRISGGTVPAMSRTGPQYRFLSRTVEFPLPSRVELDQLAWVEHIAPLKPMVRFTAQNDLALVVNGSQVSTALLRQGGLTAILPPPDLDPHPDGIEWEPLYLEVTEGRRAKEAERFHGFYRAFGCTALLVIWAALVFSRII
jgi:hypothetical protein